MKQISLLLSFIFLSCGSPVKQDDRNEEYEQYSISSREIIPEADKDKAAKFIENMVAGSNRQMTAGDYEDPEDVIEEARSTAYSMYSKDVTGLWCPDGRFLPYYEFTKKDSLIYKYLEVKRSKGGLLPSFFCTAFQVLS